MVYKFIEKGVCILYDVNPVLCPRGRLNVRRGSIVKYQGKHVVGFLVFRVSIDLGDRTHRFDSFLRVNLSPSDPLSVTGNQVSVRYFHFWMTRPLALQ